jgi:hypothetical protein
MKEEAMFRRVAVLAAGLAMTTSVGLVGAGAASASTQVQRLTPGSEWTLEDTGFVCEVDTFSAGHTFTSDRYGDSGTWSGGRKTIKMTWTSGSDTGLTFSGTFTKTPFKDYFGPLGGTRSGTGRLAKGPIAAC